MYSVTATFKSPIIWGLFEYTEFFIAYQVHRDFLITLCVFTHGSPVETQNPSHSNLIGRNTTAPLLVLSPSSILPQSFSHCAFIAAGKNSAGV
jgi:hypothetical protein